MPGRHLGGGVHGQATGPSPADGPPIDQAGAEAAWIGLGCRMDEASIAQYIATTFAGVDVVVASQEGGAPEVAWGDTFFINGVRYEGSHDLESLLSTIRAAETAS